MPSSQISEHKQSRHHRLQGNQSLSKSKTWRRELAGSSSTGTCSTQPPRKTDTSHNNKSSICKSSSTVCKYWIDENCVHGDKCEFLHSWSCGKGFSLVTKLGGHKNAITGISLPSSLNKLVTVGKDKAMRIWDCNNGQCLSVENFESEVSCLTAEGSFVFAGIQNTIKGWNTLDQTSINLSCSSDKINVVTVEGDKIFAGTEDDGSILVWKSNASGYPEIAQPLRGHKSGVVCLRVGVKGSRMFSGSRDNTIRVWDLDTMECIETLYGHTSAVMSLICWETYLLSGSMDGTIKVWADKESGHIEVIHTQEEGHGVIALGGIHDEEDKAILLVSCDDSCVRLYDLPSFEERGRLFAKKEVCAIEVLGSEGIFVTGDATGQLAVWKLDGKPSSLR
ncbi:zinc finger CCCH domain-containing protein 48-like [Impatiens glandulifera]|uniref:zinc finger CCCH domain-containing protein 48-like n=1 Tax=Impatiens glandulifera TaxID=253017 RepID=UPI001FB111A3|nr:zinc finger CCCH domain-containing protein 48-like [Impatiens glandulifera]